MLNIENIIDNQLLFEGGVGGRMKHMYEDYKMTFGEIRDIFTSVFSGKTEMIEKCDGMNLCLTHKNGKFCFARTKGSLRDPMDYKKLAQYFDGNPKLKKAFLQSADDLKTALSSIETKIVNRIFANGQNFLNIEIVYPTIKNAIDYGDKCFLQLNSIDVYDSKFNKITEDRIAAKELFSILKAHNALKQEFFEITEPNILRIKNSVDAKDALKELLTELDDIVDGYGWRCSIKEYCIERLKKYIINTAMKMGIDIDRNSEFVSELADRISLVSGRNPTKSDLMTYAKKCGLNPRSSDYKGFLEKLHSQSTSINDTVIQPIENLIIKSGILLFKNLCGYLAANTKETSQKLVIDLENAINEIQKSQGGLTHEKLKIFNKNLKNIEKYKDQIFGTEGVIINWKGKCYKVTGIFSGINGILGLLKYN